MDLWSNRNNCCFVHAIATAAIFILLIFVIGMPSEANAASAAADFESLCVYGCAIRSKWSLLLLLKAMIDIISAVIMEHFVWCYAFFLFLLLLPRWVASCIIKFYRVRWSNLCHAYFSLLWPQTKCPFKQWMREIKKRRPKRIVDGKFFC